MWPFRDQLLAHNFDAVLVVMVKLAGYLIFAKFCQDALSHILSHPRSIQTQDVVGMGWNGLGWVGMVWDGGLGSVGWVRMGDQMGAGRDSCGQQIVLFTFQLQFLSISRVFGWVLGAPGLRLSTMAPNCRTGGHLWCFKARLWVSLGAL